MTLSASFPTEDSSGNPIDDTRRIFGGMVATAADGTPRLGVIDPDPSTPLVTGTTSMAYLIKGDETFVTQRDSSTGGVELSANDAVASVATTTAPVANSRIDVIWIKCQFDVYGDSGLYAPTFGVTQGTADASPSVPSIPTGATALAHAEVTSTDTTTETVVITQVAPFTAMAGGVVVLRNETEQAAWVPPVGSPAYRQDIDVALVRSSSGWGCVPHSKTIRRVMGATNTFTNQTSYADFPVSGDASALQMSFSKGSSDTKLRVEVTGTAQLSSGVSQRAYIGIRVGSTDYDVALRMFPAATSRENITGVAEITGVAAGSLTIKPRFKASGASQFQLFTDDFVSYTITEVS